MAADSEGVHLVFAQNQAWQVVDFYKHFTLPTARVANEGSGTLRL